MSLDALVELIHTPGIENWDERAKAAHGRSVRLWLTAAPLWPSAEKYAAPWADEILRERAA